MEFPSSYREPDKTLLHFKKVLQLLVDVSAHREADMGSVHNLSVAKLKIKFKRMKKVKEDQASTVHY